MKVSWFSCGCSSFLATYLLRDSIDRIVYIHINDQHPDTLRFLHDAEAILGRKVEVIQSEQFKSVEEVIRWKKVVRTPHFAPCTLYLKKRVRTDWEAANLDEPCTYVWGYDLNERNRAKRMLEGMPEFDHEYPLIDRMLSKEDVHGMCAVRTCSVRKAPNLYRRKPSLFPKAALLVGRSAEAKRSNATGRKCRAEYAEVMEVHTREERSQGVSV